VIFLFGDFTTHGTAALNSALVLFQSGCFRFSLPLHPLSIQLPHLSRTNRGSPLKLLSAFTDTHFLSLSPVRSFISKQAVGGHPVIFTFFQRHRSFDLQLFCLAYCLPTNPTLALWALLFLIDARAQRNPLRRQRFSNLQFHWPVSFVKDPFFLFTVSTHATVTV